MIAAKRKTLKKSERLSKKKDIEALFNQGRTLFFYPYKLIYLENPENQDPEPAVKIIVTVAKRNFRQAVHRNLLKRRIREIYRHQKQDLVDRLDDEGRFIHLAIIYVAPDIMATHEMEKKFTMAIKKLLEQLK